MCVIYRSILSGSQLQKKICLKLRLKGVTPANLYSSMCFMAYFTIKGKVAVKKNLGAFLRNKTKSTFY
jgi:hypothetical protein